MKTTSLFMLLSMSIVLAGCVDSDPSGDTAQDPTPTTNGTPNPKANESEPGHWSITSEVEPLILDGFGVPFQAFHVSGECIFVEFKVPTRSTELTISLDGIATTTEGNGYMTFMARAESEEWIAPGPLLDGENAGIYPEPPSEHTEIVQESPRPGTWQIWVWPHGTVVNQTWTLTVTLEGEGAGPSTKLNLICER